MSSPFPFPSPFAVIAASFVIALVSGCNRGPIEPHGFVKFQDGLPVQSGSIEVRSLTTGERFAGRIDRDGAFRLLDGNDDVELPPGEYQAVIVQIVLTEDLALEDHQHGATVPRRYADYATSDLRIVRKEADSEPMLVVVQADVVK